MTNRTRISVVVPAYNAALTISDALDSLKKQTFVDWEAVVVDDASEDATLPVVLTLGRQDPRIRVVKQNHAGVSSARNFGIAATDSP
jgi:glycosyltransferase involved in cell wall biosynthesis